MANPKPVYIEGEPLKVVSAHDHVDIDLPQGTRVMFESSNAILIDQIAKLAKGKRLTITIAWS
jgi:hypothetical protein